MQRTKEDVVTLQQTHLLYPTDFFAVKKESKVDDRQEGTLIETTEYYCNSYLTQNTIYCSGIDETMMISFIEYINIYHI